MHQIQSGQVIVDLCSVVKELVENSLDADARSIEVRLKNSGLDAIEIQDNGIGIAETNYENIGMLITSAAVVVINFNGHYHLQLSSIIPPSSARMTTLSPFGHSDSVVKPSHLYAPSRPLTSLPHKPTRLQRVLGLNSRCRVS